MKKLKFYKFEYLETDQPYPEYATIYFARFGTGWDLGSIEGFTTVASDHETLHELVKKEFGAEIEILPKEDWDSIDFVSSKKTAEQIINHWIEQEQQLEMIESLKNSWL